MISVIGWIFSINARKQPCLHALPTSQYGRGRRRSGCLHCAPDLRFPVISLHPPGPQLSRFASNLFDRETSLRFTHSHDSDARVNFFSLQPEVREEKCWETKGRLHLVYFTLSSQLLGEEPVFRTMSRKKTVKGKGSSKSPKASPSSGRDGGRTGKGLAAAAAPSSGLVYPSRPSLSNSGEFYDIAFKVSRGFRV